MEQLARSLISKIRPNRARQINGSRQWMSIIVSKRIFAILCELFGLMSQINHSQPSGVSEWMREREREKNEEIGNKFSVGFAIPTPL